MKANTPELSEQLLADLSAIAGALHGKTLSRPLVSRVVEQLAALPPQSVPSLDTAIRRAAALLPYQQREKPWPLNLFARSEASSMDRTPGLELIFLFHASGYLREAALKQIKGDLPGPFFVAAIMWRLNDWVDEVRAAAEVCARRCFPETWPQFLAIAVMALAMQRATWGRWSSEQRAITDLADDPAVNEQIALLLLTENRSIAAGFRQLLRGDGLDRHLLSLAQNAKQPAIRAIAVECLIEDLARWPDGYRWQWVEKAYGNRRRVPKFRTRPIGLEINRQWLIELAANDPSAALRRVGLSAAIRHAPDAEFSRQLALRLRDDRAASVRGRAEFILKSKA